MFAKSIARRAPLSATARRVSASMAGLYAPARTAVILSSEPVFAGLFAYVLRGETLSPLGWVGAGLILTSIVTVQFAGRRRVVSDDLPELRDTDGEALLDVA